MKKRLLAAAAVPAGYFGYRRWRSGRPAAEGVAGPTSPVPAEEARGLVEAVLGQRPDRRPLVLNFAPAPATDWELLIDGPAFFPRMQSDIEAARSDVHVMIFGYKPSHIGDQFKELFLRKVREGVAVRLSVESGYSQPMLGSRKLYRALVAGGVEVVSNQGAFLDLDGPFGQRRIDWRFDDFLHFDHRKVVVVDGRIAFVGGPGIEDHFNDERFHDVMLRLEGPVVAQLQAVFLLSWHFQGGPMPDSADGLDRFFPELPAGKGAPMEVLLNNPGERHLPITAAYLDAIAAAGRRLYVINPYLADHSIIRGIIDAARRGAEVRVIVPADPRSLPAKAAVRKWFPAFVDAGVELREHPHMAHAKVVLADDTVLAGTANLDALSLRKNWELTMRSHDPALAAHVARELFDRDMTIATPARMPTGRGERAVNAAMSRISPLL